MTEISFRERLEAKRKALNVPYGELARRLGGYDSTYSRALRGISQKRETLLKIQEVLNQLEANPGTLILPKRGPKPKNTKKQSKRNKPIKSKKKEITKMMLCDDLLSHFSLSKDPFEAGDVPKKELWISPNFQGVLKQAKEAAGKNNFLLVYGESGTGKSLLVQELLKKLKSPRNFIIYISPLFIEHYTSSYIAGEIIEAVIGKTPPATHRLTAKELAKAVQIAEKQKKKITLVIDEAHQLHHDIMKSLKRFHEGLGVHASKLGVIMVGQPEIVGKLESLNLREVKRRLSYTVLDPFNARGETINVDTVKAYIKHKLECAGGSIDLFPDEVVMEIAKRCETPQEVNELCSYALYQAYNTVEKLVSEDIINDI